jgi:hypothetical protein
MYLYRHQVHHCTTTTTARMTLSCCWGCCKCTLGVLYMHLLTVVLCVTLQAAQPLLVL